MDKNTTIVAVVALVAVASIVITFFLTQPRAPAQICGDGACNPNENCETCPNDCACGFNEFCGVEFEFLANYSDYKGCVNVDVAWGAMRDPWYDTCVSSPINELLTKIQKAQAGITTVTDVICMNDGEMFTSNAVTSKSSILDTLTFNCDGAVCELDGDLQVTTSSIEANSATKFKGRIACTGVDACEMSIIDAISESEDGLSRALLSQYI